ncbi:MAG: S8 family serine peptidase [Candidatus Rokuibacteriota bacterium]
MPYMVIEVSPDALRVLGTMRGIVTRIEEDIDLYPLLVESVPLVQAPTAWAAGGDGQGTVIAVIDTGVDRNHPFLHGKVVEEACYVRGADGAGGAGECPNGLDSQLGPGSAQPCPSCTHGTHVAGIAAGNGGPPANVAFSGVAPGARLMAIRISSAAGPASASDMLAGLERVYLLRHTYNFAAVNMSLGVPGFGRVTTCDDLLPAMTTIIQNLKAAGIATVIASGDDGFANAVSFPACIGAAVSVASSDDGSSGVMLDTVSYFSNVAPFVSLLAPGQWITSSVLPGGDYGAGRGTSMAAPHVAAALAIMKQVAPAGSVTQFVDALRSTGVATVDTRRPSSVRTPRARRCRGSGSPMPWPRSPPSGSPRRRFRCRRPAPRRSP